MILELKLVDSALEAEEPILLQHPLVEYDIKVTADWLVEHNTSEYRKCIIFVNTSIHLQVIIAVN